MQNITRTLPEAGGVDNSLGVVDGEAASNESWKWSEQMLTRATFTKVLVALALMFSVAVTEATAQGPQWIGAFFVKGKVGLKWKPVDGAENYKIYRAAEGEEFTVIATETKTHYFDTHVKGGTVYKYKVAAVGAGGEETLSTEKSVTIPGAAAGAFEPPVWVGIRLDRETMYLNWDNVPGAIAYNVYRSEQESGPFEIVGNVTLSKFADKEGLVKGKTYYYTLTALNDEFEETEKSEVRSMKYGISAEELEALKAGEHKIELENVKLSKLWEVTEADGDMNQPGDVFINSTGDIYVTDALNTRVVCFDGNGKFKFAFGEKTPDSELDSPSPGTFKLPFTLFIDKQDDVYVTDVMNHDIQIFSADGKFKRRINVQVEEGKNEFRPNGIYVLDNGNIVASDAGNHRFVILSPDGKILKSVGSRGDAEGMFNFPDELTVIDGKTIAIVDGINCRVQEFDLDGNFIRAFGEVGQSAGTFARPKGIAVGPDGRIWVSDAMSNLIQGFTPEGEVKVALGTDENNRFVTPRGMFFRDGMIYVVNRAINKLVAYKIG